MTYTPTKSSQRRGSYKFSKWDGASPEDRFWAKVDKTPGQGPDGDCWGWLASTCDGYGQFSVDDIIVAAHRFSYELHRGPVPEDMLVRHTCDNRPCCNPDHLILGTIQDNNDDRDTRGRTARGERVHKAKLTDTAVIAIRADSRLYRKIAADHGVTQGTIGHIKKRLTWGHV